MTWRHPFFQACRPTASGYCDWHSVYRLKISPSVQFGASSCPQHALYPLLLFRPSAMYECRPFGACDYAACTCYDGDPAIKVLNLCQSTHTVIAASHGHGHGHGHGLWHDCAHIACAHRPQHQPPILQYVDRIAAGASPEDQRNLTLGFLQTVLLLKFRTRWSRLLQPDTPPNP